MANQKNSARSKFSRSRHPFLYAAVALIVALAAFGLASRAQEVEPSPPHLASNPHADRRIAGEIREVSADHIQQTIDKLVSFNNRSTISAQDAESIKAGKGIGAAREWIKAEFERYSKDCGGCLEVKTDTFTEQPGERIPKPTESPMFMRCCAGPTPNRQTASCS